MKVGSSTPRLPVVLEAVISVTAPQGQNGIGANHVNELISIDFFTVATATFRVLVVLVVLAHHRRRVLHFNVTAHVSVWPSFQP
jgi:hypothetical protein